MTITPEQVAKLAAEASPGPWVVHDFSPLSDIPSATDVTVSCSHPDSITVAVMSGGLWGQKGVEQAIKDAAFIAAAHDMAVLIVKLKAKLATCKKYSDAYLKMDQITHKVLCRTEDKLEKAVAALELYSCDDGCNECPEHERDRVSCGWTARAALAAIKENDNG